MHALTAYSRLFRLAGPGYVLVAFLGRLPMAMAQLGTLMLVSGTTGEYGIGGLAAGALAVANAVGAPIAGNLADKHGQRPVVLVQSLTGAVLLAALTWSTAAGAPHWALVAVSAATGAALPQVGPLARVRWRPMTARTGPEQRRLVDAAFSYEGAADEASFALGPALVGVVAVAVSPGGALVCASVLLAVFGTAFALHPTARMTGPAGRLTTALAGPTDQAGDTRRLLSAAFVVLVAAQWCVGVLFGATQTGTTALATAAGQPGLAGLVHAVLGVGSAVAGFGTAFIPARFGQERRVLVAAVALVALSWPLLLVDSLGSLTAVVAVLGFAVAPYMIAVFSLAERVVPASRSGAAMTALAGATSIGYASGAGLAGRLADTVGHRGSFAVTVGVTVLALALAVTQQRRLRAAALAHDQD